MARSYEELKNAALLSYSVGKLQDVFFICGVALKRPEAERTLKLLFAQTKPASHFDEFNPDIKGAIFKAMEADGIEYQKLMSAWFKMMKFDPFFAPLFELPEGPLTDADWKRIEPVILDPYFTTGLSRVVVTNLELEAVLVRLRRMVLHDLWPAGRLKTKHLSFICPLAELCYTNEYIYPCTAEDRRAVADLPKDDVIAVSIRACYEPLQGQGIGTKLSPVAAWKRLAALQITEPEEREDIRKTILSIGEISNAVSGNVRSMYEENPYPRWRYIDVPPHTEDRVIDDVLVAGCGTGRYTSFLAMFLPGSAVTGIDITLSSLAYAKQKAKFYGIKNINHVHCDILDVHLLGRKFGYINCSGVLHHMEDPVAGWKKLIEILKPGGCMYISLYSTKARSVQQKARDFATAGGYAADADGIRTFRADLMGALDGDELETMAWWRDFYSVSELRDLVFHVQEKSYTVIELKEMLDELGLEFLGFKNLSPSALSHYKAKYPDDPEMVNLENWDKVESAFPHIFAAMYNFHCKRKGEKMEENARMIISGGI